MPLPRLIPWAPVQISLLWLLHSWYECAFSAPSETNPAPPPALCISPPFKLSPLHPLRWLTLHAPFTMEKDHGLAPQLLLQLRLSSSCDFHTLLSVKNLTSYSPVSRPRSLGIKFLVTFFHPILSCEPVWLPFLLIPGLTHLLVLSTLPLHPLYVLPRYPLNLLPSWVSSSCPQTCTGSRTW